MELKEQFTAGQLSVKIYNSRAAMGQEAAREAALKIKELLSKKDEINMIFAAAPSQNEFLSSLLDEDNIRWGKVNAFHMDEYIGLASDAPQAFGNFLKDRLFNNASFKSVHYINGNAADTEEECRRYEALLKQFPADIVCMGIGENGHIAFNDPPVADFYDVKLVKVVELDEKCRNQQVHDGCFASIEQVPTHAITLTIPALIAGGSIFCVVPAKTKADAVYSTICGDISTACPASILKTHNNAVLYLDADSAGRIL